MTAAPKPQEESVYLQLLQAINRVELQQTRMEEKLDGLTGEHGRFSQIEADVRAHGEQIAEHEKKIQRAHGGFWVLGGLGTLFEIAIHKLFK